MSIVTLIETSQADALKHLSYASLQRSSGATSDVLMAAIQYLSGSIELLEPKFEFIEEDIIEPLDVQEVQEARRTGTLYHPISGQPVEDFETHVFMHFVPGRGVNEATLREA